MTVASPPTAPRRMEEAASLPILRSRLISALPGVVHGVTRRVPGLGGADGNIGYGSPRDRADAWAMRRLWASAVGVDPKRLTAAGQVHGATVLRLDADDAGRGAEPGSERAGIGDALITDRPGLALLSLHADCLAILLADPERTAVAVVHAGWRGTVADVAGAAVRAMSDAFGSDPEELIAYLGPAIGPCCYEVGPDVVGAWRDSGVPCADLAVRRTHHGHVFDLPTANRLLLTRSGVREGAVEASGVCTVCGPGTWFSHRAQGPHTGRFGAIIALTG